MRHLDIRSKEHIGVPPLTGKKVKPTNNSIAVIIYFTVIIYLFQAALVFSLMRVKERSLIMGDKALLNRHIFSTLLYLFHKVYQGL